jgi:hypothetical protein
LKGLSFNFNTWETKLIRSLGYGILIFSNISFRMLRRLLEAGENPRDAFPFVLRPQPAAFSSKEMLEAVLQSGVSANDAVGKRTLLTMAISEGATVSVTTRCHSRRARAL